MKAWPLQEWYDRLQTLSPEELCEVHSAVNGFEWDERLGEAPKVTYRDGIEPAIFILPEIEKMVLPKMLSTKYLEGFKALSFEECWEMISPLKKLINERAK